MARQSAIDRKIQELEADRDRVTEGLNAERERLTTAINVLKSLKVAPKPRVVKPKVDWTKKEQPV